MTGGIETPEIPKQLQDKLNRFQQLSQQLQITSAQLQQVQQQMTEANMAKEALEGLEESAAVYKSAGALMIQVTDKEALKAELAERVEELEVKSKSYAKHEESLQKTVEELRGELTLALGQDSAGNEVS
jgi:prefoldin beta subunit